MFKPAMPSKQKYLCEGWNGSLVTYLKASAGTLVTVRSRKPCAWKIHLDITTLRAKCVYVKILSSAGIDELSIHCVATGQA